ncbi:hypothetical protein ZIOFF_057262 [Zingiber officinale]|uniref:Uncharacterized protein n=1 Tax=Zingiber officinale TaxID=94328 RepID=A0A8J5KIB2_ZINOF|nr:hypothetical protein ZIOFF_057262 [Zingiber officinale]
MGTRVLTPSSGHVRRLCNKNYSGFPKTMDSDLWISRLAAAKRHYSTQHQQNVQSDRLSIDEFEMEEEPRPDFTCPYCYEDHDISSLCSHIEEEHAFESTAAMLADNTFVGRKKMNGYVPLSTSQHLSCSFLEELVFASIAVVCPICSIKVAKDMLNHITLQHGHIFKISFLFAIPSNQTLSLLGRDLREAHLQILLGNAGRRNNNEESNIASDSFLSSLFMNFPTSEVEESSKPSTDDNAFLKTESDLPSFISSLSSSLTHEQKEQRRKQATVRATFVQDLLFSTLFDD